MASINPNPVQSNSPNLYQKGLIALREQCVPESSERVIKALDRAGILALDEDSFFNRHVVATTHATKAIGFSFANSIVHVLQAPVDLISHLIDGEVKEAFVAFGNHIIASVKSLGFALSFPILIIGSILPASTYPYLLSTKGSSQPNSTSDQVQLLKGQIKGLESLLNEEKKDSHVNVKDIDGLLFEIGMYQADLQSEINGLKAQLSIGDGCSIPKGGSDSSEARPQANPNEALKLLEEKNRQIADLTVQVVNLKNDLRNLQMQKSEDEKSEFVNPKALELARERSKRIGAITEELSDLKTALSAAQANEQKLNQELQDLSQKNKQIHGLTEQVTYLKNALKGLKSEGGDSNEQVNKLQEALKENQKVLDYVTKLAKEDREKFAVKEEELLDQKAQFALKYDKEERTLKKEIEVQKALYATLEENLNLLLSHSKDDEQVSALIKKLQEVQEQLERLKLEKVESKNEESQKFSNLQKEYDALLKVQTKLYLQNDDIQGQQRQQIASLEEKVKKLEELRNKVKSLQQGIDLEEQNKLDIEEMTQEVEDAERLVVDLLEFESLKLEGELKKKLKLELEKLKLQREQQPNLPSNLRLKDLLEEGLEGLGSDEDLETFFAKDKAETNKQLIDNLAKEIEKIESQAELLQDTANLGLIREEDFEELRDQYQRELVSMYPEMALLLNEQREAVLELEKTNLSGSRTEKRRARTLEDMKSPHELQAEKERKTHGEDFKQILKVQQQSKGKQEKTALEAAKIELNEIIEEFKIQAAEEDKKITLSKKAQIEKFDKDMSSLYASAKEDTVHKKKVKEENKLLKMLGDSAKSAEDELLGFKSKVDAAFAKKSTPLSVNNDNNKQVKDLQQEIDGVNKQIAQLDEMKKLEKELEENRAFLKLAEYRRNFRLAKTTDNIGNPKTKTPSMPMQRSKSFNDLAAVVRNASLFPTSNNEQEVEERKDVPNLDLKEAFQEYEHPVELLNFANFDLYNQELAAQQPLLTGLGELESSVEEHPLQSSKKQPVVKQEPVEKDFEKQLKFAFDLRAELYDQERERKLPKGFLSASNLEEQAFAEVGGDPLKGKVAEDQQQTINRHKQLCEGLLALEKSKKLPEGYLEGLVCWK